MKIFRKAKDTATAAARGTIQSATSGISSVTKNTGKLVVSMESVAVGSASAMAGAASAGLSSVRRKKFDDAKLETVYVPNVIITSVAWIRRRSNADSKAKDAYGEFVFTLPIDTREIKYRKIGSTEDDVYGSIDLAYLSSVTKLASVPSDAPLECLDSFGLQIDAHKSFVMLFKTTEDLEGWAEALRAVSLRCSPKNPIFSTRLNEFMELDEQERGLISTSRFRGHLSKSYGINLSQKTFTSLIQEVIDVERESSLSLSAFFRAMDLFFLWESSTYEFEEISQGEETIKIARFHQWLTDHQKENHTIEQVQKLVSKLVSEAQAQFINAKNVPGHLDVFAFHQYFSSVESNTPFDPVHSTVYQDMTQPFSHYYCNSSHNTYLLGDQLKGKSSTQAYVIALMKGCRCVELDTWDGPNSSPIVTHGNTLCTKISLLSVIETIKEFAFKTTEYPLILSIENHCSLEQQDIMAGMFKEILGDMMPDQSWFWANPDALPSPQALKRKILLKGACQNQIDDEEDDDEDPEASPNEKPHKEVKENKVSAALSALIHLSTKKLKLDEPGNSWEMSSFSENGISSYAKNRPDRLVKHLQKQLLRIYPKGTRVDSSNYMPLTSWNVGAQIVALNFQNDEGKPLHLNQTKFSDNGGAGYLLKPHYMLQKEAPRGAMSIFSFPQTILLVEIIGASNLPTEGHSESTLIDPFVNLELFGAPKDSKSFKTKTVMNNGYNPTWREQFCFPLYYPELALLFITIKSGDMKQATTIADKKDAVMNAPIRGTKKKYIAGLPVCAMRQGSRTLPLRNKKFEIIPESKVIVSICFYSPQVK